MVRGKLVFVQNKSAFVLISNFPPQAVVKDLAIDNPNPEPSVERAVSPLTNLSVKSTSAQSISYLEIFFISTIA